jgi:oxidoreductase
MNALGTTANATFQGSAPFVSSVSSVRSMSYVALVIGSTGAVGRELVAELVESAKCSKVIALARREVPESAWTATFPSLDAAAAHGKLEVRRVDFDSLAAESVVATDKVDAAFSCLGTTRKGAFVGSSVGIATA